jgi:hypothetical protein
MKMLCSILNHRYEDACEASWKISDIMSMKLVAKRCERCNKYKLYITLIHTDENNEKSSVTFITSAKTIKFLDGKN